MSAFARTSNSLSTRSRNSRHPWLLPEFKGNASNVFPLIIRIAIGFWQMLFNRLRKFLFISSLLLNFMRASLVAQWLRIHLPMQGTWVRALVQEDPTCRGANKPVCHNYWVCALEPASYNYWARVMQLLKPVFLESVLHKRSHRNEKPVHCNEEEPPLATTRESPRAATKTQRSQK